MGGEVLGDTPTAEEDYGLAAPGRIIHEVGTTRMGDDPKTSVTNSFQQLHEANNVFITDAGGVITPPGVIDFESGGFEGFVPDPLDPSVASIVSGGFTGGNFFDLWNDLFDTGNRSENNHVGISFFRRSLD